MFGRISNHLMILAGVLNLMEAFLPHELIQYKDGCIKELNLDASKFKKPEQPSQMTLAKLDAIDHDGKCLWRCLLQKYGSLDENDEYKLDMVKKLISADVVDQIDFDKCISLEDEDPCEKSFARSRCIAQQVFGVKQKTN